MRFLSLFSGIESASVAFLPLGWECVGFSEIEPFCCEVLKYHYPSVKNLGDITKITKKQIEALGHIDVVIYGFPCQDLSMAGQRKGLKHEDGTNTRSGLFYSAARIVDWSKARWSIAENVPGLFSSLKGRDFASVVGELAGIKIGVPRNGWRNTGFALGKKGLVEWSVLDAQFFGLAQRRKRVFIVRDTGNWQDRQPFFPLAKSLCGNPPTRGEKRKKTSTTVGEGVAGSIGAHKTGGWGGSDLDTNGALIPSVSPVLTAKMQGSSGWAPVNETAHLIPEIVNQAMSAKWSKGTSGPAGDEVANLIPVQPIPIHDKATRHKGGGDTRNDDGASNGMGIGKEGDPMPTLDRASRHAVAVGIGGGETGFTLRSKPSHSGDKGDGGVNTTLVAQPLRSNNRNNSNPTTEASMHIQQGMMVRRLTAVECARLMGFPDDFLDIPFRGKPATDGHKYKSLGNSMAVPCIRWLGQRIEMIDKFQ